MAPRGKGKRESLAPRHGAGSKVGRRHRTEAGAKEVTRGVTSSLAAKEGTV